MRTLVTGGAGFIGSHVVETLLENKCHVTVIDNFSTGNPENLSHLKKNPNLLIATADISNYEQIKPYFKDIDWVFHLAALADIVPSINFPLKYFNSNVLGTVNVLEASRLAGVKRFIYAASSSCYGIPKEFPTSENADIQPQYPYAFTKYSGEQAVFHWGRVYDLPVVSLRLFNAYGLRSRTTGTYGAVFGVFLAQKLNSKPFTVVGDGNQTRDFIFVTDVANAFFMAANSDCRQEAINVGSGGTYSITRLVELLEGEVTYIPKRPGEPDCTFADINKIKRLLGWKPEVTFEKGVEIILNNIGNWRNAPVWTAEKIETATKDWFKYLEK
ncbi:MAG: SDR family oxidoreductase [bacterium]